MKFIVLLILIFFQAINCGNKNSPEEFILRVSGFELKNSFSIQVLPVRARVKKSNIHSRYSLEFDTATREELKTHRPDKIRLNLPFLNEKKFFVTLTYSESEIKSEFSFPSGWIDSSELLGSFPVKNQYGWLVPTDCIYSSYGKNNYVIREKEQKAELVKVNVIIYKNGKAIITGDFQDGDIIIKSRLGEAVNGTRLGVEI